MAQDPHQTAVNTLRALAMDAVQAANSGHPGTPMALAPLGWTLFSRLLEHDPADPAWPDRDRFVLSCGHASMLQYGLLFLSGYALSLDDIKAFRQWGSLTPGHPEVFHTPGVETTTGPLGQGLGNAVGMAMAERHLAARFNRPGHTLVDHRTWVIASDGDLMEGVAAEAASLAGHLGLGKLIVFWDDNEITIDGRTDLAFGEETVARFAAYGWHTESVADGEDVGAIMRAAEAAKGDPRPSFIRVRTIIGYPAPNLQNTSEAHGAPLGVDEVTRTKGEMGWPDAPFVVPREVDALRDAVLARGKAAREAWQERRAQHRAAFPDDAAELDRVLSGTLPDGWDEGLPEFPADDKGLATRKASGAVLAALAARVPELIGGSADLAGSNNSRIPGAASFVAGDGPPRNVDWGVREHAMGAAINGMALHGGVVPYAATFFVFSDYMRPAIRLAALMNLRTRYILTHDSIGLGEDGPTHQPVEHLASLRAMPRLAVLRPADANETRECWKAAMAYDGPAALVLTRQSVPTLDRGRLAPAEGAQRGGYVLSEATGGAPALLLLATGSEVALALRAQAALAEQDVRARVVSLPCWELFEAQDADYREAVLPAAVKARVVVEAGVRFGWERYIGDRGRAVSLEHFGASAPAKVLFERFGFTVERIVAEARRALADG
ncbi:MAG: transketolase [Myxococcales bacterium]|nr:transketolase [Myxococcales bacterium]